MEKSVRMQVRSGVLTTFYEVLRDPGFFQIITPLSISRIGPFSLRSMIMASVF